jgi:hypothetical protein
MMRALTALFAVLVTPAIALAQKPLPPLHDGAVIAGPGEFRHDGELLVQGKVTLSNLTLDLHGPIRVAAGASLELNDVHLMVSDPDGAPNGTSGLTCDGPAHIAVRRSTMAPVGSAHPMWQLRGDLEVDHFTTVNSEFHLKRVQGRLNQFKIFELEISDGSQVTARGLDLVFLSTHSGEDDHLHFANIPVDRAFTQALDLGSGAHAQLADSRMQMFLLYVHGHSYATLAHIDRVQLALFPDCEGTLRLPKGRLGTADAPAVFPDARTSNCPFHISLDDVNVDTWDIYAAGRAKLTVEDSQIDELIASDHAAIAVRNSNVYADWLAVSGDASMTVSDGIVGALRLAAQRPDLATSQIRVSGRGRAVFSGVRFDCGIVAADDAHVDISNAVTLPKYARHSGNAVIRLNGDAGSGSR